MHLKDLKNKKPAELVSMAEELEIEGASTLRAALMQTQSTTDLQQLFDNYLASI